MLRSVRLPLMAATFVLAAAPAFADGEMRVISPKATLSAERLERITDYLNRKVDDSKISGAIVLIERHGQPVYFKSFGKIDVKTGEPMTPQAIFRIHSMSKPVTNLVALMLVDDGKIGLDDPVSKYIPSFANAKVGVESKSDSGEPVLKLVPAERPITIKDLMRHSSGITYGFYGDSLVRRAYGNANLFDDGMNNAQFAEKIAQLPLAEQPGTMWDYGHSTDVLGRVIEVASGKSLYDFEKERLFGPLGMTDAAYYVAAPAKFHLIAEPLPSDSKFTTGRARDPRVPLTWQSGAGGLLMTIGDFSQFARVLLHGGELNGKRYLKPETFAAMTTSQIVPDGPIGRGEFYFPGDGFGYGLGIGIRVAPGVGKPPPPGSLGELKWDGAGGTYFWVDRAQDMFAILMIQSPTERGPIQRSLKAMVYAAFDDPVASAADQEKKQ